MPVKKPELKIDWATHEAAKYACENWHYTGKIPVNKLVKVGAWEDGKFIGVVIFGMGASAVVHRQFGLDRFEVCELVRVALAEHGTPVSRIIAVSLKFLKRANPKLRVCVSFADPSQGHHGGIYQAGNWVYTGNSADTIEYYFNGDWRHVTDVYKRLPPEKVKLLPKRSKKGKYRYVMPFDAEMKLQLEFDRKPYPKRAGSRDSAASGFQSEEGGVSPTPALQKRGKAKMRKPIEVEVAEVKLEQESLIAEMTADFDAKKVEITDALDKARFENFQEIAHSGLRQFFAALISAGRIADKYEKAAEQHGSSKG